MSALEEQARQPVLVGTRVDWVAADLLRRDVVDGPMNCPSRPTRSDVLWVRPKSARYAVFAAVGVVEQDVARLDVAMHEAAAVRGVERVGDLGGDRDRGRGLEGALAAQSAP